MSYEDMLLFGLGLSIGFASGYVFSWLFGWGVMKRRIIPALRHLEEQSEEVEGILREWRDQ